MKVYVTKAYLDMARSVISNPLHGDKESTATDDAIFSLMSCTYVFSYTALTSFCVEHLHALWAKEPSPLKVKYPNCSTFAQLMAGPLREMKVALRELSIQLEVPRLHVALPNTWRELNELLKGYRDFFVHPNPDGFHDYMEATTDTEWGFASRVAAEIIGYFYQARNLEVPPWVSTSGLRSRGFDVIDI